MSASEHEKIVQEYGLYDNAAVAAYVNEIGRKVSANTERPDVQYRFFVIDSPMVNAFALPGGYIYISRGLLALANNEAEVAAVLAHETGHVTGRHTAERYSRSVVTSLGANILSAALDSSGASQALGLGSNLYLSSYSRSQESEADSLGLRYMSNAGYDPAAMTAFLSSLQAQSGLEARLAGKQGGEFSYFSTHPATGERVSQTNAEASAYKKGGTVGRDRHLSVINGMTYGDSEKQGFAVGSKFYHTGLGFTFEVPEGYKLSNQPTAVVATSANGSTVIYDMADNASGQEASAYLQTTWMKGQNVGAVEVLNVNGMEAATAVFPGNVNGQAMSIRIIAVEFTPTSFARFQIAIPQNASQATIDDLKRVTYSFRRLSESEKASLKPYRVQIVTAKAGDTITSLSSQMNFGERNDERFMILNALLPNQAIKPGEKYKIVVR